MKKIAGIDEAGMGALAGPVVAAAVILASQDCPEFIKDSKKLSPKKRAQAAEWVAENAAAWAVAEASVEEIAELNIRKASHLAMQRAVESLGDTPQLLLVDGNPLQLDLAIPVQNVIKGDDKHLEIAAASILAKVHRDAVMEELDSQFPGYGFAQHKGYGSAQHLAALNEQGACVVHRQEYAPVKKVLTKA